MTNPTEQFREAVESALVVLGEELINYDQRMTQAKAPNIRFTYNYNRKALASIQASTAKVIKEWVGQYGTYSADRAYEDEPFVVIPVADIDQLIKDLSNE